MGFRGGVQIYATSMAVDADAAMRKGFEIGATEAASDLLVVRLPTTADGEGEVVSKRRAATVDEAAGLVSEGHILLIELSNGNWREWQAAFAAEVPEAVRDSHLPAAAKLVVGSHAVEECTEFESVRVIARTRFAFHVWSWGSPNDWVEFRRLAPKVSVVRRIRSEFAAVGIETDVYCTWGD